MKIFLSILSALVVLSLSCSSFAKTEDELKEECYAKLDTNIENYLYKLISQPGIAYIKDLYLKNNITLQDSNIVLQTISFESIAGVISLNYQTHAEEYSERISLIARFETTYKSQPHKIDFLKRPVLNSNYTCTGEVEYDTGYNDSDFWVTVKANSENNKEYLGHIKLPTKLRYFNVSASVPRVP